jgi:hypothetical protein
MPAGLNAITVTGREKWNVQIARPVEAAAAYIAEGMALSFVLTAMAGEEKYATNATEMKPACAFAAVAMGKWRTTNDAWIVMARAADAADYAWGTVGKHAAIARAAAGYHAKTAMAMVSAHVTCATERRPSDATVAREINIISSGSETRSNG